MSDFPEAAGLMARIEALERQDSLGTQGTDLEADHYEYDRLVRDVLAYIAAEDVGISGLLAGELAKVPSPVDRGWYA